MEEHKTQSKDERSGFNFDACLNSDKGEFILLRKSHQFGGGGGIMENLV